MEPIPLISRFTGKPLWRTRKVADDFRIFAMAILPECTL